MKFRKCLALALSIMLIFAWLGNVPVSAYAAEEDEPILSQEELEALGREYFPEKFQEEYNASNTISTYSIEEHIASSETKQISDAESITYIPLSSGQYALAYQVNFYNNSTTTGSNYTTVDTTIIMSVSMLVGVMNIHNFKYTIYTDGYDRINSTGSTFGSSYNVTVAVNRQVENYSGSATVTYSTLFENNIAGSLVNVSLQIYVGDDALTYRVI